MVRSRVSRCRCFGAWGPGYSRLSAATPWMMRLWKSRVRSSAMWVGFTSSGLPKEWMSRAGTAPVAAASRRSGRIIGSSPAFADERVVIRPDHAQRARGLVLVGRAADHTVRDRLGLPADAHAEAFHVATLDAEIHAAALAGRHQVAHRVGLVLGHQVHGLAQDAAVHELHAHVFALAEPVLDVVASRQD